jgi:hypothetical protein
MGQYFSIACDVLSSPSWYITLAKPTSTQDISLSGVRHVASIRALPCFTLVPSHSGTMRPYLLLLAFLPAILALQANLAGLVDWHKPLLGQPLLEPSPPSIVETSAGRRILAITQKNLLGALDDKGKVVWRQQLDEGEPVVSYHVEGESEYCHSKVEGD